MGIGQFNEEGRLEPMCQNDGEALSWVIRGCAYLSGAEGEAAQVLREAYGRGLCGLGENRRAYELYVSGRMEKAGPGAAAALKRLLDLRGQAYRLGQRDSGLIARGSAAEKEGRASGDV